MLHLQVTNIFKKGDIKEMYENVRTAIMSKLICTYDADVVKCVMSVIDRVMVDYEVTKKETAIVPYESSLLEAIKLYVLCRQAEGIAKGSADNIYFTLKRFAQNVNKPLKEITSNDIRAYLIQYQMRNNVQKATVEKHRERLNTFFKWCVNEEMLYKNPVDRVPRTKVPKSNRHAISEEQLEHCRNACDSLRDKALLEVFYSTGARVSEIARLDKSDVDWTTGTIRVFGKNSEWYTVYLNAKAKVALKAYLDSRRDNSNALFVTERGYRKITTSGIRMIIESIGKRAKLDVVLSPHVLRHTMATMALRNGARIEIVQKMLNHKSPNTTQIYAQLCLDDVAIAHRKTVI